MSRVSRLRSTNQIIEEVSGMMHAGLLQCLKEICSEKLAVPEDAHTIVVLHPFDRITIHGPRLRKTLMKIKTRIQVAVEELVEMYYYWYVETTVENDDLETRFMFDVIPKNMVVRFTRKVGAEVEEIHSNYPPPAAEGVVHLTMASEEA